MDGASIMKSIMKPIIYEQTAKKRGKVLFVLSVISISVSIFFIRIKDVKMGSIAANIRQIIFITNESINPSRKMFININVGIAIKGGCVMVEMNFANPFSDF